MRPRRQSRSSSRTDYGGRTRVTRPSSFPLSDKKGDTVRENTRRASNALTIVSFDVLPVECFEEKRKVVKAIDMYAFFTTSNIDDNDREDVM